MGTCTVAQRYINIVHNMGEWVFNDSMCPQIHFSNKTQSSKRE